MAMQVRNILLVEDNPDHAELTSTALESFYRQNGQEICIKLVRSGDECIKTVARGSFDAMVVDYHLPAMNGMEVLKYIRKKGVLMPVVMVTGAGDENIAAEAIKRGASEYMVKKQGYLDHLPFVVHNSIEQYERRLEKERLQEELKAYQVELEMSKRLASIGEMASSIAHDIKNPLSKIRMGVDFLKKSMRDMDGATIRVLDGLLDGVENLNRIAVELLNYAKPPVPMFHLLDVQGILNGSLNDLEDEISNSGIVLIKEYYQGEANVSVDGVKLKEVFLNIIRNAIEAMPMGGTLTVRTSWIEKVNGRFFEIQFEDTGEGISKKHIEKVFAPFFTTKQTGTGLGLSVVKKIMDIHNGYVEINSKVKKGTTIILQIPARRICEG